MLRTTQAQVDDVSFRPRPLGSSAPGSTGDRLHSALVILENTHKTAYGGGGGGVFGCGPESGDAGSAPAGSKAAGGGSYHLPVNETKVPSGSYPVELV